MIARKQLSRLHEIEATSVAREMIKRSQVLENILGKSEKGVERIVRMILGEDTSSRNNGSRLLESKFRIQKLKEMGTGA